MAHTSKHGFYAMLVLTALLLVFSSVPNYSKDNGNPNPRVSPINSSVRGMSYGEWRSVFGILRFGTAPDKNPWFDVTGEASASTQSKHMFVIDGPGEFYRTVAPGTPLWVPLGGSFYWPDWQADAVFIAEWLGYDSSSLSEAELMRIAARWDTDHAVTLFCEIDGLPLQNLHTYRNDSPIYSFYLDPGIAALYGLEPGFKTPAFSSGYNLILTPLPPGTHLIRSGSHWEYATAKGDPFNYTADRSWTCHLTVK